MIISLLLSSLLQDFKKSGNRSFATGRTAAYSDTENGIR